MHLNQKPIQIHPASKGKRRSEIQKDPYCLARGLQTRYPLKSAGLYDGSPENELYPHRLLVAGAY